MSQLDRSRPLIIVVAVDVAVVASVGVVVVAGRDTPIITVRPQQISAACVLFTAGCCCWGEGYKVCVYSNKLIGLVGALTSPISDLS